MQSSRRRGTIGALAVTSAAVLWGLWPLWVRRGPGGAATGTVALGVACVAGAPAAIAAFRRHRAPRSTAAWGWLALFGVTDASNVWCYFRALEQGAVAPAALSHYLAPVLVALAAPLTLGEPRSRRTPLALALALAGTAILVLLGRPSEPASAAAVTRALGFGAASAVFYAINVLLAKRLARDFGNSELMVWHTIVSFALLAAASGLPPARTWLWPALGGLTSALAAGVLYFLGLRRMPAEQAGVLTYVEPLAAVLVGWLAFAETPSPAAIAGGALIVAGGVWVVSSPVAADSRT